MKRKQQQMTWRGLPLMEINGKLYVPFAITTTKVRRASPPAGHLKGAIRLKGRLRFAR